MTWSRICLRLFLSSVSVSKFKNPIKCVSCFTVIIHVVGGLYLPPLPRLQFAFLIHFQASSHFLQIYYMHPSTSHWFSSLMTPFFFYQDFSFPYLQYFLEFLISSLNSGSFVFLYFISISWVSISSSPSCYCYSKVIKSVHFLKVKSSSWVVYFF